MKYILRPLKSHFLTEDAFSKTLAILLTFLGSFLPMSLQLHAAVPAVQKLFVAPSTTFGDVVAASPNYLLASSGGGVFVFQANTGVFIRKLSAGPLSSGDYGSSLACSANYGVVGDPNDDNGIGAATVFDLSTGKVVQKLISDVGPGEGFGISVAICGNVALIGAYGSAYVFDIPTGTKLRKLVGSNITAADAFGAAVALSWPLALVGIGGGDAGRIGEAYVFDVTQGNANVPLDEMFRLKANDGHTEDQFGTSVSICGKYALIGAPGVGLDSGAAYLFDLTSNLQIAKMQPTSDPGAKIGSSVAMHSNLLVIGAAGYGEAYVFTCPEGLSLRKLSSMSGSIVTGSRQCIAVTGNMAITAGYVWRNLAGPLPGRIVSETTLPAPQIDGAVVSAISSFQTNAQRGTMVQATMTGLSTAGGKNVGIWTDSPSYPYAVLDYRTKDTTVDTTGSLMLSSISNVAFDRGEVLVGTLFGPGVTSSNSSAIVGPVISGGEAPFARRGSPLPTTGGSEQILAFQQLTNKGEGVGFANTFRLGVGGVTSTNDSAVGYYFAYSLFLAREGAASAIPSVNLGQLVSRTSVTNLGGAGTYACGLTSQLVGKVDATNNAALFLMDPSGSGDVALARKGELAPAVSSTAKFSSFVAECADSQVVFRATVTGEPTSSNEALFVTNFPDTLAPGLLVKKGATISGLPTGVRIASFQHFWISTDGGYFVQATLTGTGVNAANDVILLRYFGASPFDVQILMREGDTAPDCNGAKIGVIQQVNVNSEDSCFAVIATLTGSGSDATNNLALWEGKGSLSTTTADQFKASAFLRVRKGSFIAPGYLTPTTIRSMRMTIPSDASGAGNRGLGSCVGGDEAAVLITLSDGRVVAAKL